MSIRNLEPKAVWENFYQLTQIPRPSKKEAQVIEFTKTFGEKLGLETIVDKVGNVIIKKPATKGMENRKTVVLQAHLDMVPQKNSNIAHDFEKDPIKAYIDGDWVTAEGTTLGSDNGMGVAAAMAVLQATDLSHGPIEVLLTMDEETGMTGAFNLEAGLLNGDILLNLDSEDEGELYIGCAGGADANAKLHYTEVAVPSNVKAYKLSITGLKGGHSGLDINLGRGNANKILVRLLKEGAMDFGLRLAEAEGGNMRNAIPRESFATITIPTVKAEAFEQKVVELTAIIKKELSGMEPNLSIVCEPTTLPGALVEVAAQKSFINAVYGCPSGVIRMSDAMPGVVETSTNLSIIKAKDGEMAILSLLRSSVDTAKRDLQNTMRSIFELAGACISFTGEYPGWKPKPDADIIKVMQETYQMKYNKTPEIKVIHAGLECGIIGAVYPNMDMVSFGPTIRYPHSPDEKVNIATVQLFWDYLVETLKNIPVK